MGEQPRRGQPLVDHVGGHGGLGQRFTLATGPFAMNVALDLSHTGDVVQLFGHVFADAFHLAATGTGSAVGFVVDFAARQLQCRALGLFAWPGDLCRAA